MKIKCIYKSDCQSYVDFCRFTLFKEIGMKIYLAVFFVALFGNIIYMSSNGGNWLNITLLVLTIIIGLVMSFVYFVLPKQKYKMMYGKFADPIETEFVFEESFFAIYVKDNKSGRKEKTIYLYNKIYRAYEVGKYFFLYMDKNQAYILKKSEMNGGENPAKQLSEALKKNLKKKYRKRI